MSKLQHNQMCRNCGWRRGQHFAGLTDSDGHEWCPRQTEQNRASGFSDTVEFEHAGFSRPAEDEKIFGCYATNDCRCARCGHRRGEHSHGALCCPLGGGQGWSSAQFYNAALQHKMKATQATVAAFDPEKFLGEVTDLPPFRIGGYYKQRNGQLRRVDEKQAGWPEGTCKAMGQHANGVWYGDGLRYLADGRYKKEQESPCDLMPIEVNEKGVPLEMIREREGKAFAEGGRQWPFPLEREPITSLETYNYLQEVAKRLELEAVIQTCAPRKSILEACKAVQAMEDPSAQRDRRALQQGKLLAGPKGFNPFSEPGWTPVDYGEEPGKGPNRQQRRHPLQQANEDTPWAQKKR